MSSAWTTGSRSEWPLSRISTRSTIVVSEVPSGFFPDQLHLPPVGEIAQAADEKDGLAHGQIFVGGNLDRALPEHLAHQVDFAARMGAEGFHADDHGGVVEILLFEQGLEFEGELLAGFTGGGNAADEGQLEFARVGDRPENRVFLFLDHAIADPVAVSELHLLVELVIEFIEAAMPADSPGPVAISVTGPDGPEGAGAGEDAGAGAAAPSWASARRPNPVKRKRAVNREMKRRTRRTFDGRI